MEMDWNQMYQYNVVAAVVVVVVVAAVVEAMVVTIHFYEMREGLYYLAENNCFQKMEKMKGMELWVSSKQGTIGIVVVAAAAAVVVAADIVVDIAALFESSVA